MTSRRPAGVAFLGVGAAFVVLGITGQRVFLGIGVAFLALGIFYAARRDASG